MSNYHQLLAEFDTVCGEISEIAAALELHGVTSEQIIDRIEQVMADRDKFCQQRAALRDAGEWLLHVLSGVGKAGHEPEQGEYEAACEALKNAVKEAQS